MAGGAPLGAGRLGAGRELLGGAEALVADPLGQELVGRGPVLGEPWALEDDRAVPVEAQPAQRVLDADDPLVAGPGPVRVLDAQDELPAVVPGEEPVEQRGTGRADVEKTGRGRR